MKRHLFLIIIAVFSMAGCNRSDGDRLARVGTRATKNLKAMIPERIPISGSIGLTNGSEMENRVRQRFRSDRYLSSLSLEIICEENAVRLKGQVDDPLLKRRASEIAESTIGVEKVIDEIVVAK
jgi:hypothetical protein